MRILVCLKVIRGRTENEPPLIINPNDANALETALRIKDQSNDVHITLLSLGPKSVEVKLKELYAYKVDEIVLVADSCYAGSDTLATSYTMVQAIHHMEGFDLILCGCHTSDGNTGQVAPEISARIGMTLLSNITHIERIDCTLQCERVADHGVQCVKADLPLIATCVRGCNELRIPTIRDIMKADSKEVSILTNDTLALAKEDCGLLGSPTRVTKTERIIHHQKGEVNSLSEESVHQMIQKLKRLGCCK